MYVRFCQEIVPLTTLAKYYGVSTDYLLGVTDNKEHHLFPVDELGLDDTTVEILKSGDLNVRLICEMIKNPAFANFISDMEYMLIILPLCRFTT